LRSERWLALLLCFSFLGAQTLSAQQSSSAEPISLTQQIENLKAKERQLVQRLTERNSEVTELTREIEQARLSSTASADSSAQLQERLNEARAERDASRKELRETSSSLEKLQQTQKRSEKASQDYQEEATKQIAEVARERDTWKLVAIVSWIVAAGAALAAALK